MPTIARERSCSVSYYTLILILTIIHDLTGIVFEGHGNAVLYTGDIRSEPWFVNCLTRSPYLVEYACSLKTLDTIYLDTSFIDDTHFQTKAEGIRELLQKVAKYPPGTIFHFQAWTYG